MMDIFVLFTTQSQELKKHLQNLRNISLNGLNRRKY